MAEEPSFLDNFNDIPAEMLPLVDPTILQMEDIDESNGCVARELFDVDATDWFIPKLAPSTSRSSSGVAQNCCDLFLDGGLESLDANPLAGLSAAAVAGVQCELEALTPDVDVPDTSFRVITTCSQLGEFPGSMDNAAQTGFDVNSSRPPAPTSEFSTDVTLTIGNEQLSKYTVLGDDKIACSNTEVVQDGAVQVDDITQVVDPLLNYSPGDGISLVQGEEIVQNTVMPEFDEAMLFQERGDSGGVTPSAPTAEQNDMRTDTGNDLNIQQLYEKIKEGTHADNEMNRYVAETYMTGSKVAAMQEAAPAEVGGGGAAESVAQEPKRSKKRSSRKRKMSKREAAKAASAAEMAREEELAMLAKTKQITDDELLRLKPKKQRRAAKFEKPVPSRFCHVCSRTPKNVRLVVCTKIKEGTCRKVICEKCFEEYEYGNFEAALATESSSWMCPHCAGQCPERAQCRTYQRINDRLRVNRLKQERPKWQTTRSKRARRVLDSECTGTEDGFRDDKRPRFLLPALEDGEGMGMMNFEEGQNEGFGGNVFTEK